MRIKPFYKIGLFLLIIPLVILGIDILTRKFNQEPIVEFDGIRSFQDVEYQVALGPRTPGSRAHLDVINWIIKELEDNKWKVELQEGIIMDQQIQNIIARKGSGHPLIILGAHYDSRLKADKDPDINNRDQAVPGANDGASGVAILLELSRVLEGINSGQVWLVFFDAEDQGYLPGWDWILGSRYFVTQLQDEPDAVVIVDMLGDSDLNIYFEHNSNRLISQAIWDQAKMLKLEDHFIPEEKYSILDDHTPFLEKGYPAVDIIDFDYPYWHTISDTPDKVSPSSLQAVGKTLQRWIINQYQ
jgi:glutaminyl-peptide cyclotransferase